MPLQLWYGIVEFNVPLDTGYVISEMGIYEPGAQCTELRLSQFCHKVVVLPSFGYITT